MIHGAHVIISSTKSDADRAFFKDVLGLSSVDVGGGWLIFGLPPSEVAVHPGEKNDEHALYLMCDDIAAFGVAMRAKGVAVGDVQNQGWGLLASITLPGGGKLGVYEPRHARPKPTPPRSAKGRALAAPKKKAAAKKKAPAPRATKRKAAAPKRRR